MNELDALRAVDFEWAMRLSEVWSDSARDVPGLHAETRSEFARKLDDMRSNPSGGSPLGWVVVGAGGTGKTHLLGSFRREATRRKCAFVLVDMTDVRTFWETVLQGFIDSLQQPFEGGVVQFQWVLRNIITPLGPNKPIDTFLAILGEKKGQSLLACVDMILSAFARSRPTEARKYGNAIRALICLNARDALISGLGMAWLQGRALDDEERKAFGFSAGREHPTRIVEALSWLLTIGGPMVLAFDQLDPIVTQLHYRKFAAPSSDEHSTAESIIAEIGGGLGSLRDLTRDTLTVVACVEATWEVLKETTLKTSIDRFLPPVRLSALQDEAAAASLVRERLAAGYARAGFVPEYPTQPFRPSAFGDLKTDTPREVLKKCEAHRAACLRAGRVVPLESFSAAGKATTAGDLTARFDLLDAEFSRLIAAAEPGKILEEGYEDDRLAPLLRGALKCLIHETELPRNVNAVVDTEFTGGEKTRPLHARLRLIFEDEQEREEHYCVRAVQQTNARAYQSRLKAAMTQSGIDRALKFRRLRLVRSLPTPGGAETRKLTAKFEDAGGAFLVPTADELRAISALHEMDRRADPAFDGWLKARRPVSSLGLIREIAPIGHPAPADPDSAGPRAETGVNGRQTISHNFPPPGEAGRVETPVTPVNVEPRPELRLPIGRRLVANRAGEPVGMPLRLLEKHTLVLAGAGSGKTVLLKRLIEEAVILGVPSIVIDCANDLATLGEAWPTRPEDWTEDDSRKAELYHRKRDVVLWTPGREAGNPLSFEPLPDLSPLIHDEDELEVAVAMARESLSPVVAPGRSPASQHKQGILSKALRFLAAQSGGGGLPELIELLGDLPPEAGLGLANERKLARQIADSLTVETEKNPLLRSQGSALDFSVLFGDDRPSDRTRVSVINMVGLPGLDAQRSFLNQLAMTLFSWLKRNPDPGPRALRGLLVIDEAKDFVPSRGESVCGESLIRLAAQARKYHLGLIFATQNPKDIDHKVVANCSTHFYGKVNSPAAIETVREQIRSKGGNGEDVPRLSRGQFYAHNADADIKAPTKIVAPLCLSRHPGNPLDEAGILKKASESRTRLLGP